jgi:hypothetical protein
MNIQLVSSGRTAAFCRIVPATRLNRFGREVGIMLGAGIPPVAPVAPTQGDANGLAIFVVLVVLALVASFAFVLARRARPRAESPAREAQPLTSDLAA